MGGQDIWENYCRTRDPALREQLVLQHLGLVKYLAGRLAVHVSPAITREDLEGYGVIGLLDAIDKYNHNLGTAFKNYAYTRIRGAMLDEVRKQSWVPRSKWSKFHRLNSAREKLRQKGLPADEQSLAAEMGMDNAGVRKLVSEYYKAFPVSLDEAAGLEHDGALGELVSDPGSPDPLEVVTEQNEKEILAGAVNDLPDRDKLVLALYYQEDLTLKEIGSILELTESRVCQLHARALQRLREKLYHRGKIYSTRKKGARI